ncbi:MAG: response regulator transcription factor [Gemmatimonadaceae bacterium]
MSARPTILLVEDDGELGEALRAFLDGRGFDVIWFRIGLPALDWLTRHEAALCLLDVMLPRMDGFEIAACLREAHEELPIVFLTARGLKPDRMRGFGLGADDYLVKPVDEDELVARIEAVLRRTRSTPDQRPVAIGRYVFDRGALTLSLGDWSTSLTEREASLLGLLCDRRGSLLRSEEALRVLWRRNDVFTRRSMDVFVHRLRRHLRRDPAVTITRVRGVGLVLDVRGGRGR